MTNRIIISIIAFTILTFFAYRWHNNHFCCQTAEKIEKVVKKAGPIVYNWDNGTAITNDLWPAKKKSILKSQSSTNELHIVGEYYSDEKNVSTFKDMGIARAESAKKLMLDKVPSANIITSSKKLSGSVKDKSAFLELVRFSWAEKPVKNENVEVIDDEVIFHFPYRSSKKLDNANINDYLKKLSSNLSKNNKSVVLVGHTDSKGSEAGNKTLGMKRANAIMDILVSMGIDAKRISASSMGETQPVETNDTDAGRQANRRVTLKLK